MLNAIAGARSGTYMFLEKEADVAEAFGLTLGGLLSVYARDLRIRFDPMGGTAITQVLGDLAAKRDGAGFIVPLAQILAEQSRDILVELALPAVGQSHTRLVLRVTLQYIDSISGEVVELATVALLTRTDISNVTYTAGNVAVDAQLNRLIGARALAQAAREGEHGKLAEGRALLDNAMQRIMQSISSTEPFVKALIADMEHARDGLRDDSTFYHHGRGQLLVGSSGLMLQTAVLTTSAYVANNVQDSVVADFTQGK
jgi:hypothetical protein